jgi:hypothetical protein
MSIPIGIAGIGTYFPPQIETAADLVAVTNIPEDILREKMGIRQRHVADDANSVVTMASHATEKAMKEAGVSPEQIKLVISHGSEHKDHLVWNAAAKIQHNIGAINAYSFEMYALCAGAPIALNMARVCQLAKLRREILLLRQPVYRHGELSAATGQPNVEWFDAAGEQISPDEWPSIEALGLLLSEPDAGADALGQEHIPAVALLFNVGDSDLPFRLPPIQVPGAWRERYSSAGDAPIGLADYGVCLVRNTDRTCSVTDDLGTGTLAPGAVTTVCRRKGYHPASTDPDPPFAIGCDLERAGVRTFSGDDRLLVLGPDGAAVDALGRVGYTPPPATWANLGLRRCTLAPADGVSFYDHRDYFTQVTASNLGDWGVAPVATGCR